MVEYNVDLGNKVVLVTGVAGFIGANLAKRLLDDFEGITVIGVDSVTDYYDVRLKDERLLTKWVTNSTMSNIKSK